tara:strand:+ start:1680 stop:2270 length:591 start_codon:yes stop_codon:yes gene_type:complete
MGDLIIKPASSGSLKIQDQAGTNFITTGTSSGLTLGTAVTFPAGHVLQVVQNESTETNDLTTSYVNLYEVSITLKSTSSDVYGFFYFQYKNSTTAGFGVKVYRNNSATVTTSHTAVWTKNLVHSSGGPFTWYNGDSSASEWDVGTVNPKDSLSGFSIGDTLYYGFFARKYDSNNVIIGGDSTEDGFISSTLMEVQK